MGLCNGGVSQTEHCSSGNDFFFFFGMFIFIPFHPGGETSDKLFVCLFLLLKRTQFHTLCLYQSWQSTNESTVCSFSVVCQQAAYLNTGTYICLFYQHFLSVLSQKKAEEAHKILEGLGPKVELVSW